MFHFLVQACAGNQRFRRNAPPIQTNAADRVLFNDGDGGAFYGRPDGRRVAAGAGSDDGNVVFFDGLPPCLSAVNREASRDAS